MKCSVHSRWGTLAAGARRAAAVASLSFLAFAAPLTGVHAQGAPPNDIDVPTPYSWTTFHNGGTSPGALVPPAGLPAPTPPNFALNPRPDLLSGQLQGVASGLYPFPYDPANTTLMTEIPSFLLGNWDPARPPGPQDLNYFSPNNFRDALVLSSSITTTTGIRTWSAPFTFLYPAAGSRDTNLILDDSQGNAGNPEGQFTTAGGWSNPAIQDGTATDGEYLRVGAQQNGTATAAWQFTVPTDQPGQIYSGFYAVTFHIPDSLGVAADNSGTVGQQNELRIDDAHYIVVVNGQQVADVRVSQNDANANQVLAGPFFVAGGNTVTVTLDNSTNGNPAGRFVVADSVTLQPGFGADVQSPPTAINFTEFPEITNALYYGVLAQGATGQNPANPSASAPDILPRGNLSVVDPALIAADYVANGKSADDPAISGKEHMIRQLVYFGRSENIILQDPNGNLVDDFGIPVTTPVIRTVGAIYCVDGFTGSVVWRYQTADVYQTKNESTTFNGANGQPLSLSPSAPVFSAPAVARINVITGYDVNGVPTYATKLVVIVGDNNGLVYCLDAIGNRDGTSNSDAVSANNQPIYYPLAPKTYHLAGDQDKTPDAAHGHVGNTSAYWIYRPNPNQTKDVFNGPVHNKNADGTTVPVPASDLPIPQSFGTASPTIYVNPDARLSKNKYGQKPGDAPDATLTADPNIYRSPSNATVYIGNSNGTLYALDALGVVPGANTFNGDRGIGDRTISAPGVASNAVPTCDTIWWYAINGSNTNQRDPDNSSIVSAPSIWATDVSGTSPNIQTAPRNATVTTPPPTPALTPYSIFFATANDGQNEGRLYSIGATGLSDNSNPNVFPLPILKPGTTNYNNKGVPNWAFPKLSREPLGSMSGSPVVFMNPDYITQAASFTQPPTHPYVYVAASSGVETQNEDRPGVEETGRLWCVDCITGNMVFAYPNANDPNVKDYAYGPNDSGTSPPVGAFRRATPAIGIVQFPHVIIQGDGRPYNHTDAIGDVKNNAAGTAGRSVPMLYIGSAGTGPGRFGPRFYGLDLDASISGGQITEDQADVFRDTSTTPYTPGIVSPSDGIQTSPALLVNSSIIRNQNSGTTDSTGTGSGGALFVGIGTTLYQIDATPITNQDTFTADAQPTYQTLAVVPSTGAISSPAVAAAEIHDLDDTVTPQPEPFLSHNVLDWVIFGDRGPGVCRAVRPANLNGGAATAVDTGIQPVDTLQPNIVLPQFPLYSYLFDGTTNHPGTSQDMSRANPTGPNSLLPVFEWGQNVYIRIGNVVPPAIVGGVVQTYVPAANSITIPDNAIVDPDDAGIIFTNGGPVSIQISELNPQSNQTNQTDSGQVPATILPTAGGPGALNTNPPGNGFVVRTDGTQTDNGIVHFDPFRAINNRPEHLNETLKDVSNRGWIGAYTYAIRSGAARKNTPGSTRRVINAVQTAQAYAVITDANNVVTGYRFLQTVTLQTTVTQGGQYTRVVNGQQRIGIVGRVDQPTFGILNPLAAQGGGIPLFAKPTGNPKGNDALRIGDITGPFAGVDASSLGTLTADDLPAYVNGNSVYRSVSDVPRSGVLGGARRRSEYRRYRVTTALGEVNHGTSGDNADPKVTTDPPVGQHGQPLAGLGQDNNFGPYMLNVADRSVLGLASQTLRVTMEIHNGHWNDNTGQNGPGAVVNYLPWESLPAQTGPNPTLDYPNVPRGAFKQTLNRNNQNNNPAALAIGVGGAITNTAAVADPASGSASNPVGRNVYPDPVQVSVSVPRFQPANLQLFDEGNGSANSAMYGIAPNQINTNHYEFPEGYNARRQRVYVDTNRNGSYDEGEAYRFVNTYLGVPVDMTTTVENSTVDLGKLPQSTGIQTDAFNGVRGDQYDALGTFMPYDMLNSQGKYPPRFRKFFQPLTILNRGNVNLLNVHLDQKVNLDKNGAASGTDSLKFFSDTLDSQTYIPAFDFAGISGPRSGGPDYFLLRSSLDTDLVQAYGRNPGIVSNNNGAAPGLSAEYPSATFHKARVSTPLPPQLTVPDVPNDNTLGSSAFALYTTKDPLKIDANNRLIALVPNATTGAVDTPFAASVPYVGLAVPLGTPVGTYSQRVQLFEGIDAVGYQNIGQGTTYTPLLPPLYGGQAVVPLVAAAGLGASPPNAANMTDIWYPNVVRTGSTPALVKGTVTEARITDGLSFGTLPQVDPVTNKNPQTNQQSGVADFLPSAFRNAFWNGDSLLGDGSLALTWTTSRAAAPGAAPYNIAGATLGYQKQNLTIAGQQTPAGYFSPSLVNNLPQWWKPMGTNGGLLFTSGLNTGMVLVPDQEFYNASTGKFTSDGTAYAFVQSVTGGAGSTFQSQLLCYPVTGGVVNTLATPTAITQDPGPAKNGVRGLKFTLPAGETFQDPLASAVTPITNNLWAFWQSGTRGRSVISYSSADTTATGTGGLTFTPATALPIPAGLVSVSDPSALLVHIPVGDPNVGSGGTPTLALEVTYTGIAPDGNADLYVSRYRPYFVRSTQGQATTQVGLTLIPSPKIREQLQSDTGNLWWQARDVAWLREGNIQVNVNGIDLLPANATPTYDRQSGTLVYPATVTNQLTIGTQNIKETVYVDLARGRVRFSPALPLNLNPSVYAAFFSQARRITTDARADTVPIAFLDQAFKPNAAPNSGRVQADRYWFIWRKSGSGGTATTPTLFYKTQRLTVDLRDANNQPVSIKLDPTSGRPNVTVTVGGTTLYSSGSGANSQVDVDWARGRVYFPIVIGGTAMEGQHVTGSFSYVDSAGKTQTRNIDDFVHWLDEPRFNDLQNQPGSKTAAGAIAAASTAEVALPIDTIVNESNVSAFLDPMAYADVANGAYDPLGSDATTSHPDQPHRIWLFWNSTRNGTADLYYETFEPRFTPQ